MKTQPIVSGITVIICCYNSELRLPETLRHLADQQIPDTLLAEIILVNNASTDSTAEFAETFWHKLQQKPFPLIIVNEKTPGQMHARIKGANEARYDVLVFCDDDNLLQPDYLAVAHKTMALDKAIGAAGGQSLPITDAKEFPDWFDTYKDKYATGIPAEKTGEVTYKGFLLGAGLITRKNLFLEVFSITHPSLLNGRNGEALTTGDDFEYCKRIILWNYKLYYNQDLVLHHLIPKARLSIAYRERLLKGIDEAGIILNEYDLAIKTHKKIRKKNKLRLLILTPIRILLAKAKLSKRNLEDEKLIFYYASPFQHASEPIKNAIKLFIKDRQQKP